MATLSEKADFVADMVGKANELHTALQKRKERAEKLEQLVGSGLDGDRDAIRQGMTFSVKRRDGKGSVQSMDERGQRKSIETEDIGQYESIDPKAQKAAHEALARVLKIKKRMEEEGFTAEEIITELFTPLVREGLMPENLVVDGYSEVAIMLREVIKSYKETLRKQIEEKRLAEAKAENDFLGGGTKMDVLKGLGSKANSYIEGRISIVADSVGMTSEEFNRAREIMQKGKAFADSVGELREGVGDFKDAMDGKDVGKPEDPKLSEKLEKLKLENYKVSSVVEKVAGQLTAHISEGPLKAVLAGVEKGLMGSAMKFDALVAKAGPEVIGILKKFAKLIETDGVSITKDVVAVLIELGMGIKDIAPDAVSEKAARLDMQTAVRSGELRSGVNEAAAGIEQVLKNALLPAGIPVSDLVSRGFVKALKVDDIVEMVRPALGKDPNPRPDGGKVIGIFSAALSMAVEGAHASLKGFGAELANSFAKAATGEISRIGGLFSAGELADPAGLLLPLVGLVDEAAATVFDEKFVLALAAQGVGEAIKQAATDENNKQQQLELDEAKKEIEDFERTLVLIDEGGMAMARQKSLDVLIAQMRKDELDLQIVTKVGSLLSSGGKSITEKVVGQVGTQVAKEAAATVVPALKAAELVMTMSVTIIKIAQRGELLRKFKADVEKARKASSYLQPSIENFYSAKVQQQVYAQIELALQIVQLAGSIAASVPEPITMAVGQLLTKIAEAGETTRDLAKSVHDEALLRKGWKVTLEALNNPRNRRAGLDALRHNATLAVHSVAWAAQNGHVMALEIMRSCGVDAQTMADEGTDQDKLIEYLETLLSEDLQFKDTQKLKLEWVPQPLVLSYAGWFTLKRRAATAQPPLAEMATADLDKALKLLDTQPSVPALRSSLSTRTAAELEAYATHAEEVANLLGQQKPYAKDRSVHDEMLVACEQLKGMGESRASQIRVLLKELELEATP